jgi:hypothetical protein
MYCSYYTAPAHRQMIWLIIAHIKSNDNVVFHRTMDGTKDMLEFFVSPSQEYRLVEWLELYKSEGVIFSYEKKQNRFLEA